MRWHLGERLAKVQQAPGKRTDLVANTTRFEKVQEVTGLFRSDIVTAQRLPPKELQAFASRPCYHGSMTTFLGSDDAVDFAKSRRERNQDHIACFLHLRDLVYLHPNAAPASAVLFVRTLEAKITAAKAAREGRQLLGEFAKETEARAEALSPNP
jgi:hypothetical protein